MGIKTAGLFSLGLGSGILFSIGIDPETTLVEALSKIIEEVASDWPIIGTVVGILLFEYWVLKEREDVMLWFEAAKFGVPEFMSLLLGFLSGAFLIIDTGIGVLILVLSQPILKFFR